MHALNMRTMLDTLSALRVEQAGLPDAKLAAILHQLDPETAARVQGMLDGRMAAFRRRGVELPPPMVVADSWFSDSKLMRHMAMTHQGTFLVEGKRVVFQKWRWKLLWA
jgi:hypothetical protein